MLGTSSYTVNIHVIIHSFIHWKAMKMEKWLQSLDPIHMPFLTLGLWAVKAWFTFPSRTGRRAPPCIPPQPPPGTHSQEAFCSLSWFLRWLLAWKHLWCYPLHNKNKDGRWHQSYQWSQSRKQGFRSRGNMMKWREHWIQKETQVHVLGQDFREAC